MRLTWWALSDAARRECNLVVLHGPQWWAVQTSAAQWDELMEALR